MIGYTPRHMSASQLSRYLACPRQYRYHYVDRVRPESISSALLVGGAVHEALAYYYREIGEGRRPPPAIPLHDTYRVALVERSAQSRDDGVTVDWSADGGNIDAAVERGRRMLDVFVDAATAPHRMLAAEHRFEFEIHDPDTGEVLPPVVGAIDALVHAREQDEETGHVTVLEHKTGRRAWSPSRIEYDPQCALYSRVARRLADVPCETVAVTVQLLTKTITPRLLRYPLHVDARAARTVLRQMSAALRGIAAGVDLPVMDWHCQGCGYRRTCREEG